MKSKYKNISLIGFLFIALSVACLYGFSLAFSSIKEDKDYVILNELGKYDVGGDDKVLFSFPEYKFDDDEQWISYSHTYDTRFSKDSYSSIFRVIDNVKMQIETSTYQISLSDITHYDDIYYNFGNVELLESDGIDFSKLFEDNSVYIDKYYADALKDSFGVINYSSLFNREIQLEINGCAEWFKIKGLYDENAVAKRRCFNKQYYDNFGHTFFISRSKMNEYDCGKGYFLTGFDVNKNSSIFDFVKSRFSSAITPPHSQKNESYLVRGIALPNFKSTSSIPGPFSFPVAIVFVLSAFAFGSLCYLMSLLSSSLLLVLNKFKEKYYISFMGFAIFMVLLSLLLYYFFTNVPTIFFGALIFKNSISNWFYFIVVFVVVALFGASTYKNYYFDYFSNLFKCDYGFLNKEVPLNPIDLYKVDNKFDKTAIVFSRGIDSNSAGGQRAINDALLLKSLGYNVWLCGFASTDMPGEKEEKLNIIKWPLYRGKNLLKRFISYMNGRHIDESINKINNKIDLILVYSVLSIEQIKHIKKYANYNNVEVVYDSVEYQNLFEQSIFSFFTYYIPNMYINNLAIKCNNHVIAISKYLENHYSSKRIPTYRMPFINRTLYELDHLLVDSWGNKRVFAYTGVPGKKDDLYGIIKSYSNLSDTEREQSMLIIAGPKIKDLYKLGIPIELIQKIKKNVLFVGRQPYSRMKNIYAVCDFTVLLKKSSSRHAKADFPSKVSQSLSFGIPVITNSSSDLSDFLLDNYNSIIFDEYSCEKMTNAFRRALSMSDAEITKLKTNALQSSRDKLSFDVGQKIFNELLDSINSK